MIKALVDLLPWADPLLGFKVTVLLYPHMVEGQQDNSL